MKTKRDKSGNCAICGIFREVLCMDHIIPKHKGGPSDPSNIQLICANCHQDKTRLELRAAYTGKTHSAATRVKMSAAQKGHSTSVETRRKIGTTGWNPERCANISAAKIGHAVSTETRKKISAALVGRTMPVEIRQKISATEIGTVFSLEHRKRLSVGIKLAWERRREDKESA